jgi:hypothetical protein
MLGQKFYLRYNAGNWIREKITMDEVEVVAETSKRFTVNHNGKSLVFVKETLEPYGNRYGKLLPINGKFTAEKKALDEANRVIYRTTYLISEISLAVSKSGKLEKLPLEKLEQIYSILGE